MNKSLKDLPLPYSITVFDGTAARWKHVTFHEHFYCRAGEAGAGWYNRHSDETSTLALVYLLRAVL